MTKQDPPRYEPPKYLLTEARVTLVNDVGNVFHVMSIQAKDVGMNHLRVVPREKQEVDWTRLEARGPLSPGRFRLRYATGKTLIIEMRVAVPSFEFAAWGIDREYRKTGFLREVHYEPAAGKPASGELIWGPRPEVEETDAELRERLRDQLFPAVSPVRPTGVKIAVPCSKPGCGHTTVYPVGVSDPKEMYCPHVFDFRPGFGARGVFECRNCRIAIPLEQILDAGVDPKKRYDPEGNALADAAQSLRDENTQLHAKISRLSTTLEAVERKLRRKAGG